MRYWYNGEDEDIDRELERVRRFGGPMPAPIPWSDRLLVAILAAGEVLLFLGLFAVLMTR